MATDLLTADASSTAVRAVMREKDRNRLAVQGDAVRGESAKVNHPNSAAEGRMMADVGTAAAPAPIAAVRRASLTATLQDFVQLTKPRIVVMILVTTVATAMIAAGGWVPAGQMAWLLIATAMVAGSAGAANQVWERVIDQRMVRTASRPLPAGRLRTLPSAVYAGALGVAGTWMLASQFGPLPALVGAATWLLYVLVYTPMKTRTAWNTTVGAVAGALPVLIGYTATGGSLTDASGWLLFGVLVAWQYPHFMSIAWMYRRQYAEAGFCMTTTVDPSGRSAGWQSVLGSLALLVCGVAHCWLDGGWIGGVIASIAVIASSLPMLLASIRFAANPTDALARKLLRSSLLVLPAILMVATLRLLG